MFFLCSILLVCQTLTVVSGAQCPKQPTVDQNKKILFEPLNGKIDPVSISTKYDAQGLQPFFNLANSFMDTVQGKKLSEELKGLNLDDLSSDQNREKLIKYETPVLIAAGFGAMFMILMPFIGLFFCCCRCCGKCGGKRYQDQKAAERHCVCKIMTACLFIVSVMILCGCMFMFVTNTRTHETAQNLGKTYDEAIDSVVNIANSTKNILNDEIIGNFVPCLLSVVKNELSQHGINANFGGPLKDFVNANVSAALDTASTMATTVDKLKLSLDGINAKKEILQRDGKQLKVNITNLGTELDSIKGDCNGVVSCIQFVDNIKPKINMNVNFDNLPDVNSSIDEIKAVKDRNISKQVQVGRKTVNEIPITVYSEVSSKVNDIITKIDGSQKSVEDEVNTITKSIDESITERQLTWKGYRKDFDQSSEIFKYENYRSYAYVGISSLMAFIVLLLFGGMALGICGYNKEALPSTRSKSSTCGGNCLMSSVGFMFIFSFFLMLFCTLWYMVGIQLHFVCRDLKDASIFDTLIADKFNLTLDGNKVSVQSTLGNCRSNLPLFQSIGGETIFNLSSKLDFKELADDIDKELEGLTIDLGSQTIMTSDIEQALTDLIASNVDSINFTEFFTLLDKSVTGYNLTELANNITKEAKSFPPAAQTKLNNTAASLKIMDSQDIPALMKQANNLKPDVTEVQSISTVLKTNGAKLLAELKASEHFLQKQTVPKVFSLVTKFTALNLDYLVQGTDFVINQATNELLRCKPVSDLYDGVIGTFLCDDVVQNANGFWLALGWCMLFFIPAIILSVKLAKYYRRMEYDSGLDQFEHPPFNDKIPLQTYDHNPPPPYSNPGYNNQ